MVSTCLRISAIPISAWRIRLRPSNRNGLVTMPIVSAPRSRAICEMMGAAPVPVPPPMPQVTNTRSAPQAVQHFVAVFLDGLAADLRARARAQAARELLSDLHLHVGLVVEQGLRVGVHGDELDALESLVDHAVQGVAAAAAHADDFHPGVLRYRLFEFEDHGSLG